MRKIRHQLFDGFAFVRNGAMIVGVIGCAIIDRAVHPVDTYRDRERLRRI